VLYFFTVPKRLKIFAAVLVLMTLPMQSMAAASMLICNGADHAAWLTTIVNGKGHTHAGEDASPQSHQHATHGANDHHSGTADPASADRDGVKHHPASSCSSCSVCCCAASLPSPGQSMVAAIDSSSAAVSAIAQPVSGYVPDRLDRPPRSNLA
jgi:hypothetical protein